MANVKDILIHVSVETAKGKRKCYRNAKNNISLGDRCLIIKGGSYNTGRNYCLKCANEILKNAEDKLESIKSALDGN